MGEVSSSPGPQPFVTFDLLDNSLPKAVIQGFLMFYIFYRNKVVSLMP
jgi:hypothetical protein